MKKVMISRSSIINSLYSQTFRIEWTSQVTLSIVELAQTFNLIAARLDVLSIDWQTRPNSFDITLANCTIQCVRPLATSQVSNNFTIPIDCLESPKWNFILQRQKHQTLVNSILLLLMNDILSLVDAILSACEAEIGLNWRVIWAKIESPQMISFLTRQRVHRSIAWIFESFRTSNSHQYPVSFFTTLFGNVHLIAELTNETHTQHANFELVAMSIHNRNNSGRINGKVFIWEIKIAAFFENIATVWTWNVGHKVHSYDDKGNKNILLKFRSSTLNW